MEKIMTVKENVGTLLDRFKDLEAVAVIECCANKSIDSRRVFYVRIKESEAFEKDMDLQEIRNLKAKRQLCFGPESVVIMASKPK